MTAQPYVRTELLTGQAALERMRTAQVVVLGVGGVGCYIVEALARVGTGKICLVDGDVFEKSNLNRQLYCVSSTIGKSKVQVARERVAQIDPAIEVRTLDERLTPERVSELLDGRIDYVADAIDDVPVKMAVACACAQKKIPLLACMGTGNKIGSEAFIISDIFSVTGDPIARKMRGQLRKNGIDSLEVCWSCETPRIRGAQAIPSISFVPGMAGLTMAGHIIRRLMEL